MSRFWGARLDHRSSLVYEFGGGGLPMCRGSPPAYFDWRGRFRAELFLPGVMTNRSHDKYPNSFLMDLDKRRILPPTLPIQNILPLRKQRKGPFRTMYVQLLCWFRTMYV
ncbi:hypothetical protein J6590_014798 [Homalodisca vitripennis]|nr:hypothetical protein J6590_014798 [Homalodisca vitripennis]